MLIIWKVWFAFGWEQAQVKYCRAGNCFGLVAKGLTVHAHKSLSALVSHQCNSQYQILGFHSFLLRFYILPKLLPVLSVHLRVLRVWFLTGSLVELLLLIWTPHFKNPCTKSQRKQLWSRRLKRSCFQFCAFKKCYSDAIPLSCIRIIEYWVLNDLGNEYHKILGPLVG